MPPSPTRNAVSDPSPTRSPIGQRVHVVGNSCSGKSTLATRLARVLDADVVELDALNWQPSWIGLNDVDPRELERRIAKATAGERWVMGAPTHLSRRRFSGLASTPWRGSTYRCFSFFGGCCGVRVACMVDHYAARPQALADGCVYEQPSLGAHPLCRAQLLEIGGYYLLPSVHNIIFTSVAILGVLVDFKN